MIGVWTNQNPIQAGLFTQADQQVNAREIWGYFQPRGWKLEAVAGMLGNMELESYINPAQWQLGSSIENPNPSNQDGYGLVQWTPWQNYPNAPFGSWSAGANWRTDYLKELDRIQWEMEYDSLYPNQGQWIAVSGWSYITFEQYAKTAVLTPQQAAMCFYASYERGTSTAGRAAAAANWYNYLNQYGPLPPTGGRLPIWLLFKLKERWS